MKYLFLLIVFSSFIHNQVDAQKIVTFSDKDFSFLIAIDSSYYDYNMHSNVKSIAITRLADKKIIQRIIPDEQFSNWHDKGNFIIEDMNFDGYNDIRLLEMAGKRGNEDYYCWLYNPYTKKFERDTLLEEITGDHYFDSSKKRIEEGWHESNGFGGQNVYKWINNKVTCIFQKEDTPEFYDGNDPKNYDKDGYRKLKYVTITISKRVNGQLKIVYSKKFTAKEYENLDYKQIPQPD